MDIPSSSPVQSAVPPTPEHSTNARGVIIGGVALIIIAAALAFGVPFLHHGSSLAGKSFAFASGPLPGSALYAANSETGSSTPITVTVDGKALRALDALRATDGTWYFMLNEGGVSNLYKKASDGMVTRLTHSSTAKYNLSFDQASGRLAYQAFTPPANGNPSFLLRSDWDVTVFDQRNSSEMVIATGTDPFLVSGGTQVLLRKGTMLVLQVVGQKASAPVLSLPSAVYSINPEGTMITVFNPVTNSLDQYSFVHGFSPNYTTSIKIKGTPTTLGYIGGKLVASYLAGLGSDRRFVFTPVGSESADMISLPAITSGAPQRIYAYE